MRGISLDLPALPPAPAEEVKRDNLRAAYQSAMDKAGEKADSAHGHSTPTRFTRMDEMRRKHQERKQKAEATV